MTIIACVAALAPGSVLAFQRMAIDIFPKLDLPVIYIAQPYNGMMPEQMESQIVSPIEGHSIYIGGLHHVEIKNIQNIARREAVLSAGHRHGGGDGRNGRLHQPGQVLPADGNRRLPSSPASTPAACRSATWFWKRTPIAGRGQPVAGPGTTTRAAAFRQPARCFVAARRWAAICERSS